MAISLKRIFPPTLIAWWVPRPFESRATRRGIPAAFGDWRFAAARFVLYGVIAFAALQILSNLYGLQAYLPSAKTLFILTLGVPIQLMALIGLLWLFPRRVSLNRRGISIVHGQHGFAIPAAKIRRFQFYILPSGSSVLAVHYDDRKNRTRRKVLGIPQHLNPAKIEEAIAELMSQPQRVDGRLPTCDQDKIRSALG